MHFQVCALYICFVSWSFFVDKIDFMRDVGTYILVLALIVGVSYDGKVSKCSR